MENNYKKKLEDLTEKNEALKAVNKSLNQHNKELKQFSYLASHDLQQPLNNIISYLSLLEDSRENLDDLGNLSLNVIKKSTYKMKRFITGLLEYVNIGNNTNIESIALDDVLQTLKEMLSEEIKASKAKFNITLKNHHLNGDRNNIQHVFLNLIENALKFSRKNVPLKIKIDAVVKDDKYLYSISDNGIGIDEKYFEKIFSIFYTINRDEEYEGVGIGLAECKKNC